MKKILLFLAMLWLFSFAAHTEEGQVKVYFFYSEECQECAYVKKEVLPPLLKEYGEGLAVRYFDIEKPSDYELLVRIEEAFKDFDNEQTPFIAIDRVILSGKDEAEKRLPLLIKEAAKKGGVPWPLEEVEVEEEVKIKVETGPTSKPDSAASVYLAYLYETGCPECARIKYRLDYLKKRYPSLWIKEFNIDESRNKELAEGLGEIYQVKERLHLSTPAIFVGEKALIKNQITDKALDALLKEYVKTGTKNKPWEEAEKIREKAKENILNRFKSFGILPIILAGLVDGINPCAFTMLTLLIAYLAFVGRKGKSLIFTGAAFTFGVFLTYLLIGLGLLKFLTELSIIKSAARYIYFLTALLAFAFGGVNLYNYSQVKKGTKIKETKLRLPDFFQKKIMDSIKLEVKEDQRMRGIILGAFVAGVVISLLELTCTGQVYLPTIVYVASLQGMQLHGFFYLFLYNLLFIFPLIIVFVFSYLGTNSEILTRIRDRYLAKVELITAVFFFLLGGLILYVAF